MQPPAEPHSSPPVVGSEGLPEALPLAAAGTEVSPSGVLPVSGELWLGDLKRAAPAQAAWLWRGYLAPGNVTLMTSQWKAGKTTLLSILLAKMKTGGVLGGLPLKAGKAAVVSEESPARWLERSQKLDFGTHVCWFCRPFQGKPRPDQWMALLDRIVEVHSRHTLDLVAIDPLASFFPGRGENSAEIMMEFLLTLQRLTALGLSVFLQHHPTKAETGGGLSARGSGALSAFVDVLIEMTWHGRASENDRRRRLLAFSRSDETPRQLVVELNAEGTDYVGHGSFVEEEFTENWKRLLAVLTDATKKLTRTQIVRRWPPGEEAPPAVTLWRWLERAVGQGLLLREGGGRRKDPFRYWLPARQEMLRPDGGTQEEMQAWNTRCLAHLFDGLETKSGGELAEDAPLARDEDPTAAAHGDAPEAGMPPEPDPPPSPAVEPVRVATPEAPVRLPYPFNIMNPRDVPERVWKQARPAGGNP